ncbi:MAG TPA: biliverdin-producing heme oxygenase [Kofleriaceae bacterium]
MAQLRDATAALRDDRELLAGRASCVDYRMYLLRMYGFHANVERALKSCRPLAQVVADAPLRNHKSALLAHDLVALGVERIELVQAPRMAFPGAVQLPEALGWSYVVEAVVQGGRQLARHLQRHLPAELSRASAYLGCYGGEAAERWRELGAAIDAYDHAARDADRIVAAARDGFGKLAAWVRPALPTAPMRIHA